MTRKLLTQALQIAHKEHLSHPEWRCYLHWTFVVVDGRICEWATNKAGQPAKQFGYHPAAKIHSELAAYKKSLTFVRGQAFQIINVRLNRTGHIKLSAPCGVCAAWLRELGCVQIWYTTAEGLWKKT